MNGAEDLTPAEVEAIRSASDELERYAHAADIEPRPALAGRILAAIAEEPTPAPLR